MISDDVKDTKQSTLNTGYKIQDEEWKNDLQDSRTF